MAICPLAPVTAARPIASATAATPSTPPATTVMSTVPAIRWARTGQWLVPITLSIVVACPPGLASPRGATTGEGGPSRGDEEVGSRG